MKVEVFKCSVCGKLHEQEKELKVCLKQHEAKAKEKSSDEKLKQQQEYLSNYVRLNATCLADILPLTNEVIGKLSGGKIVGVGVTFHYINYNVMLSNSHSCPLNGVTNWGGKEDKPKGYPGYSGSFKFVQQLKGKQDSYPKRAYDDQYNSYILGVNTGTGNGNETGGFSGSFSIFIDDFPLIKERIQKFKESCDGYALHFHSLQSEIKGNVDGDVFCQTTSKEIEEINKKIAELTQQRNKLQKELREYKTDKYVVERQKVLDSELEGLTKESEVLYIPVQQLTLSV